jgi:hypothetical protein
MNSSTEPSGGLRRELVCGVRRGLVFSGGRSGGSRSNPASKMQLSSPNEYGSGASSSDVGKG